MGYALGYGGAIAIVAGLTAASGLWSCATCRLASPPSTSDQQLELGRPRNRLHAMPESPR